LGEKVSPVIRVHGVSRLPPSARKPRAISSVCRRVFASEKIRSNGELNVVFLDRAKMRALNKRFLDRAHDTDVIAFDYAEDPGPFPGERPFGDIFISAYLARKQAAEHGHSVLSEVLFLTAHGALHIIGYDDSSPAKRRRMFAKQTRALAGSATSLTA
jgi:probable rRNA maturation factor